MKKLVFAIAVVEPRPLPPRALLAFGGRMSDSSMKAVFLIASVVYLAAGSLSLYRR